MDAGNAVVLTTVGGMARHHRSRNDAVETGYGESFVVDCSRTDYDVNFNPDHLQVNLTIPHAERFAISLLKWSTERDAGDPDDT